MLAYISTGATGALFTLRVQDEGGDTFIRVLSNDRAVAAKLLAEYCEGRGYTNGGFEVEELRAITRKASTKAELRKRYDLDTIKAEQRELGRKIKTEGDKVFAVWTAACCRCGGTGSFGNYGVCYRCGGEGHTLADYRTLRIDFEGWYRREQARERSEIKREHEAELRALRSAGEKAEREANSERTRAANLEAIGGREAWDLLPENKSDFVDDMIRRHLDGRHFTDAQAEALRKVIAGIRRDANAESVVEGRIEITGEIISLKWKDGFGYHSPDVLKAVIRDDRGFRVFGTIPAAFEDEVEKGHRVTFTATVERSDDDSKFGFYKRPSKFSVCASEAGV